MIAIDPFSSIILMNSFSPPSFVKYELFDNARVRFHSHLSCLLKLSSFMIAYLFYNVSLLRTHRLSCSESEKQGQQKNTFTRRRTSRITYTQHHSTQRELRYSYRIDSASECLKHWTWARERKSCIRYAQWGAAYFYSCVSQTSIGGRLRTQTDVTRNRRIQKADVPF